jgi:3-deoxy-D-manno-octulosonic-acid transferase
MRLIYNTGIYIYLILVRIAAPFNHKAKLWVSGRKHWYQTLKSQVDPDGKYIWVHCASLGEFEQGRPVIEAIKKKGSGYKIILTFFSPSGYEIRKNYGLADIISYLPSDRRRNAERFISLVNPQKVIFVKYEFWYNYISVLDERKIPLYIISAIFRQDQYFFKWYGVFFRRLLNKISGYYVQDQQSADVLRTAGLDNVIVAGDTRFDRVVEIADNARHIREIELFRGEEKVIIAGSTWKGDEEIIAGYINKYPGKMKWIIAPHEIENDNIERLEKLVEVKSLRFSVFSEEKCDARVLIIDNIGMLSSAYRYAHVAIIGGGFGRGIHNLLEAACWGIPVLFGPNHKKFREALELIKNGGGKSFTNYTEFEGLLNEFIYKQSVYKKASEAAFKYVRDNAGATHKIIAGIT